jgi:signal peptidase I
MIGFLKKRKLRKQLKEYLHAARHARHMREDIADPKDVEALEAAEAVVREIRRTGKGDADQAVKALEIAAEKVYPLKNRSGIRENVEVIIVAIAAAMTIHAFFFKLYKIPTGSMQPTLNGITTEEQVGATWAQKQPFKFFNWLITGESYKEVQAETSGSVSNLRQDRDRIVMDIGGVPHAIPSFLRDQLRIKPYYNKGDIIASAKVIAGDHILVNKMAYNFGRPERGDIAVFDTKHIPHPQVRKDTFYIKRMVGLSGEKIQIQNRRIVADGKVVSDPVFEKIATDPAYGGGHRNDGELLTEDDFIQLADDEYLMMGDNTPRTRLLCLLAFPRALGSGTLACKKEGFAG